MRLSHFVAAALVLACAFQPARAADIFANQSSTLSSPAQDGAAITPSDSTPLAQPTRAIYVGGAGDVVVILLGDSSAVTFKAVPVGTWLWVRAATVKSTGTTATNLLALW